MTGGQVDPGQATAAAARSIPGPRHGLASAICRRRASSISASLSDGRVLVMGGDERRRDPPELDRDLRSCREHVCARSGHVRAQGQVPGRRRTARRWPRAIAGGGRSTEILDLTDGTSRVVAESAQRGSFATINLLGSGDLLIVGGYDDRIRLRDEMVIVPVVQRHDPGPDRTTAIAPARSPPGRRDRRHRPPHAITMP